MTNRRDCVVAEAITWEGTPYHHQARVKGQGVDCAMLLAEVYCAQGLIPYIDPRPYPPDWHFHQTEERYLDWTKKYGHEVKDPKPGDIVLYRFGKCISHGAIVIQWPTIIHALFKEGCVRADGTMGQLDGRIAGFYSVFDKDE